MAALSGHSDLQVDNYQASEAHTIREKIVTNPPPHSSNTQTVQVPQQQLSHIFKSRKPSAISQYNRLPWYIVSCISVFVTTLVVAGAVGGGLGSRLSHCQNNLKYVKLQSLYYEWDSLMIVLLNLIHV
jgi:hypothetical protein